jgi:CDP-2,3-bis-(O-geranylgeranyl)-sn-glycerol synthase
MWQLFLEILALLLVANGAPILIARVLRSAAEWPVDLGARLADGNPLFGNSKTWRGLVASLLACTLFAPLLGFTPPFGLVFAALAMTGDLLSSSIKRRRGLAPGAQSPGLDQLPEAVLPSLFAVWSTGLPWWCALLLPPLFMLLQVLISQPLYRMKIRKRPH